MTKKESGKKVRKLFFQLVESTYPGTQIEIVDGGFWDIYIEGWNRPFEFHYSYETIDNYDSRFGATDQIKQDNLKMERDLMEMFEKAKAAIQLEVVA